MPLTHILVLREKKPAYFKPHQFQQKLMKFFYTRDVVTELRNGPVAILLEITEEFFAYKSGLFDTIFDERGGD